MDSVLEKNVLRQELKAVLLRISHRDKRSQELLDMLLSLTILQNVQTISLFISLPDEPDTTFLARHCWTYGIRVFVPEHQGHLSGTVIQFREWTPSSRLVTSSRGLFHPAQGELFKVDQIDLIFVPGLAFTHSGLRLGRGGGFYDRLLSGFKGVSVGICFREQIKNALPKDEHDVLVDRVVCC
ncbi:MAG: 5-formyltetrahydrofolate cyclo-ligase [bacterium]|nr:5-formyltetrahydrofolate cyclo-ligase [bacterium]